MVLEKIKIKKETLIMYLQSRHPYELEVKGVLLPKKEYTDREMQVGKRNIVKEDNAIKNVVIITVCFLPILSPI